MPASDYQKYTGTIRALSDHVLVKDMEIGERITTGGIIIGDDNGKDRGVRARWCQAYKVGDKITDIKEGDWLYVEHGRWTYGFDFFDTDSSERVKVQRVDIKGILGISDTKPF